MLGVAEGVSASLRNRETRSTTIPASPALRSLGRRGSLPGVEIEGPLPQSAVHGSPSPEGEKPENEPDRALSCSQHAARVSQPSYPSGLWPSPQTIFVGALIACLEPNGGACIGV